MKKSKAFTLAILALACAIAAISDGQSGVAAICLAPAVLFGGIWLYKYWRDNAIISKAHEQREHQLHHPTQPLEITQPITNQRNHNNGLFVPPPLD